MKRLLFPLVLVVTLFAATPTNAQTPVGNFSWRVEPFCSVINVTVIQVGSVFTLTGYEEQCGGNPRLPVYGVALLQENGQISLGFTTIFDFGNGLHTNATLALDTISGTWRDNANQNGNFVFNPGPGPFTGGPRITPIEPDTTRASSKSSEVDTLKSEVADLKKLVAEILARSKQ
jgi:hypothetical protein